MNAHLAELLRRSAAGDVQAFLRFYDATIARVFTLEVTRARARGVRPSEVREAAARAAESRYVAAWRASGEQAGSGLSPGAWLLSLPVDAPSLAAERRSAGDERAACA